MIKKSGLLFFVLNKTAHLKMLSEFYLNCLKSQLSASQLLTLEMLVWLLQFHKQVRIERLAACLPLPVLYESRRRHVQRDRLHLWMGLHYHRFIKCNFIGNGLRTQFLTKNLWKETYWRLNLVSKKSTA
jgi:hypothetical protein